MDFRKEGRKDKGEKWGEKREERVDFKQEEREERGEKDEKKEYTSNDIDGSENEIE